MAADLHIHVFTGITEDDLAAFSSNTIGSKYFRGFGALSLSGDWMEACRKIGETPDIWIGELSWLKQALMAETEGEYVPSVVQAVHSIIGEDLPVCDDELIERISHAFDKAEEHGFYSTNGRDKVVAFLEQHRGERLFTVSW